LLMYVRKIDVFDKYLGLFTYTSAYLSKLYNEKNIEVISLSMVFSLK